VKQQNEEKAQHTPYYAVKALACWNLAEVCTREDWRLVVQETANFCAGCTSIGGGETLLKDLDAITVACETAAA
jgi:hypothetical protein